MATVQEVLADIQKNEIRWIDLQFVDIEGYLRHISIHSRYLNPNAFSRGLPRLDPTNIRSLAGGSEELILMPDPDSYSRIPWDPNASRLFCSLHEPAGGPHSDLDSRYVAKKAESTLTASGYSAKIGLQVEFFIFDNVTVDALAPHKSQGYAIDSREAAWNFYGQNYPVAFDDGYMAAVPKDALAVFRSNVSDMLEGIFNIEVSSHRHGRSTTGHCALEMKYAPLMKTGDNLATLKYVVKNAGAATNVIPTFLPKPLYNQRGSSLRVHQSLWIGDKNAFFDSSDSSCELSQLGRYYIGGILAHSPSLCAITNSTTNSYKRLVGEGMTRTYWGIGNRAASVRVPVYEKGNEDSKRIDYKVPDPGCNPYLCISAIAMAGLDGIKNKVDPGDPMKGRPTEIELAKRGAPKLPRTLSEAVENLRSDSSFLKAAFPAALLDRYFDMKKEDAALEESMPTPLEFRKYLDI